MSINLGNGSNGIHEMAYTKLTSIEDELREIRSAVEGIEFRVSAIEDHLKPAREVNPFAYDESRD